MQWEGRQIKKALITLLRYEVRKQRVFDSREEFGKVSGLSDEIITKFRTSGVISTRISLQNREGVHKVALVTATPSSPL